MNANLTSSACSDAATQQGSANTQSRKQVPKSDPEEQNIAKRRKTLETTPQASEEGVDLQYILKELDQANEHIQWLEDELAARENQEEEDGEVSFEKSEEDNENSSQSEEQSKESQESEPTTPNIDIGVSQSTIGNKLSRSKAQNPLQLDAEMFSKPLLLALNVYCNVCRRPRNGCVTLCFSWNAPQKRTGYTFKVTWRFETQPHCLVCGNSLDDTRFTRTLKIVEDNVNKRVNTALKKKPGPGALSSGMNGFQISQVIETTLKPFMSAFDPANQ
jgi:hypothetical protein